MADNEARLIPQDIYDAVMAAHEAALKRSEELNKRFDDPRWRDHKGPVTFPVV